MHFSLYSVLLFAFSTTLASARYYPRSEDNLIEIEIEDDGFKVEEYGFEDDGYKFEEYGAFYEFSFEDLAQIRRQYQKHRKQRQQKQQQKQKQGQEGDEETSSLDQSPAQSIPSSLPKQLDGTEAFKKRDQPTSCKRVADCNCPNPKTTNSCFKYKCICGDKATEKAANTLFIQPIAQGLKKVGDGINLVLNDVAWGVRQALKLGSWAIPGVGKTAAKALEAIIPETKLKTGNAKADEIINAISKAI